VHIYVNGKMIFVETIPGIKEGGDEKDWWRGYIVRSFVNATMYSHLAQQ
jgi:hypothetical protein